MMRVGAQPHNSSNASTSWSKSESEGADSNDQKICPEESFMIVREPATSSLSMTSASLCGLPVIIDSKRIAIV